VQFFGKIQLKIRPHRATHVSRGEGDSLGKALRGNCNLQRESRLRAERCGSIIKSELCNNQKSNLEFRREACHVVKRLASPSGFDCHKFDFARGVASAMGLIRGAK
jgi:hypothetical protein